MQSVALPAAILPLVLHPAGICELRGTEAKHRRKCFTSKPWLARDEALSHCAVAEPTSDCFVTAFTPSLHAKPMDAARLLMEDRHQHVEDVTGLLVARRYTMTFAQVEQLVEAAERGEDTCVRKEGGGNVIFFKTGGPHRRLPCNPVSMLYFFRAGGDWTPMRMEFTDDYQLDPHFRILVPNYSPSGR